jgi:hypothetical protein
MVTDHVQPAQSVDRRFAVEIAVLVVAKLVLLYVIWHAWFATPLAIHMHVAPDTVMQHVLGDTSQDRASVPGRSPP